jgi:hypothetical protein
MAITYPTHPLTRDGKSQTERLKSDALAPEKVRLDDRSERQLLVYLNEFAKSVAYYEYDGSTNPDGSQNNNLRQSNWQNFFKASGSVQVSLIEAFDATGFETAFLQRQQNYTEGLTRDQVAPIFDFLFETALRINGWHAALASDEVLLDNQIFRNESPLQRTIADLVRSNLRPSLIQLISIANIFETANPSYHAPDLTELFGEDKPFGEKTLFY